MSSFRRSSSYPLSIVALALSAGAVLVLLQTGLGTWLVMPAGAIVAMPAIDGLLALAVLPTFARRSWLLGTAALLVAHVLIAAASGALHAVLAGVWPGAAVTAALASSVPVVLVQASGAFLVVLPFRQALERQARGAHRRATVPPRRRTPSSVSPRPGRSPRPLRGAAGPPPASVEASPLPRAAPPSSRDRHREARVTSPAAGASGLAPGGPELTADPIRIPVEAAGDELVLLPGSDERPDVLPEVSIRVPVERILGQLPPGAVRDPAEWPDGSGTAPRALQVPTALVLAQLAGAHVEVPWDLIADQFPRGALISSADEIGRELPGGRVILPLDVIVPQVPPEILDLPSLPAATGFADRFPAPFAPRPPALDDAASVIGEPASCQ